MRIDHLRYLIEIDKQHSISAAAQTLYLGQTSLSTIVKSLEQELGFAIFERTHNGVKTTPEGEDVLSLIWELNCRFEEIMELGTQNSTISQPIPIITSPTINSALALPLNNMFLDQVPYGNLDFQVVSGEDVGPMVIRNDGNIGVTYFGAESLENYRAISNRYQIETDILLEDRLYLLVAKDHPLAKYDSLHCKELEDQHFALLPYYSSQEAAVGYAGILASSNRHTTFSNISIIKRAVLTQKMVALLSGYAIHYNHSVDNSLLKTIALTGTHKKIRLILCLIHRTDSRLSFHEKIVVQCIKNHFKSISLPQNTK